MISDLAAGDRVELAHYIDTQTRGRIPEGTRGTVARARARLVVVYFDFEADIRDGSLDHGGWQLEPSQLRLLTPGGGAS